VLDGKLDDHQRPVRNLVGWRVVEEDLAELVLAVGVATPRDLLGERDRVARAR
jgi:hypothetical protein